MRLRLLCLVGFGLAVGISSAQSDGIGDPTFPTLGNKGYLATHYGLNINYNPDTNVLKGDVTMDAVATADLAAFSVDFAGFQISGLKLNGVTVPYERTSNKLRIKPAAPIPNGSKFSLETIYAGSPAQAQSAALPPGMKSGWIHYASGAVAVCEPDLAHTWFPCNDHPRNKATFDIDLATSSPYIAIANGVGTSTGPNKMHFVMDKPALTCMAVAAFGKFGTVKQVGPNNLPILNYVPLGQETQLIKTLEITPKFFKYLSDRLGPYPFASYGTIILPDKISKVNALMAGAALETTSIPVFGPGTVMADDLCHELTHQWMGDCVSVTNWGDDIWWVEGFAQYSQWLLAEEENGKAGYEKAVMSQMEGLTSGQWLKPGHLTGQQMFSTQSYVGGALTFYALRKELGDDKFFQTVRQFIDKNRYGNASAKDWIEVATKVAGKDMKPFFDAWLYGDTMPKIAQ